MGLINNIYVFVADEKIDRAVDTTSHPTEQGLPLSDTMHRQPVNLSLTGKIVDTDKDTAETIAKKITSLQKAGSLITYIGQVGILKNMQIQSFNTNYNHKNNGGADFDMSLKEVRIAKKAYVKTSTPKVEEKKIMFKLGDKVRFLGGYVYVSSEAKSPACKRMGGSRCKITAISTLKNRKHIYHLISQDCKYGSSRYVYGWVDAENVTDTDEFVNKTSAIGGTQQPKMNKYRELK